MNQDSEAPLHVEEPKSKLDFLTEAARRRRGDADELQETFLENQVGRTVPGEPRLGRDASPYPTKGARQWSALHD